MTAKVELKTERLLLRPFKSEDLDDVYAYTRDPEWERYIGPPLPLPYTRPDAEEYVARCLLADWTEDATFAIVLESTVIGSISLRFSDERQRAELGYALARAHWEMGLMTEAATAVIDYGFVSHNLAKIHASADVRNVGSYRVMEKVGMVREGVLRSHRRGRGERIDSVLYGILRHEWEEQRQ